jgi:hypothetical protein
MTAITKERIEALRRATSKAIIDGKFYLAVSPPELCDIIDLAMLGLAVDQGVIGKVVRDSYGELGIYGANLATEWEGHRVRIVQVDVP